MSDAAALARAYEETLREEAETADALAVERFGPLVWAEFADGGFVTSRRLQGYETEDLVALVGATILHFRDFTTVPRVEWKVREGDPPVLLAILREAGFVVEGAETVMAGDAHLLATRVPPPPGVTVRRAGAEGDLAGDVRRVLTAQAGFAQVEPLDGDDPALVGLEERISERVSALTQRGHSQQLWYAESGGEVVGAGRVERVASTSFAGLWGGGVALRWRGRGVYGTLVSTRARVALDLGAEFLYCDCTEMSRPILQRCGLERITTTTPYVLPLIRGTRRPGAVSGQTAWWRAEQ